MNEHAEMDSATEYGQETCPSVSQIKSQGSVGASPGEETCHISAVPV